MVTSVHQHSLMWKQIEPPLFFPNCSIMRSTQWRWKPGSCNELSRVDSPIQLSVKLKSVEREKCALVLLMSRSSSISLAREQRFARWMYRSKFQSPCCLNQHTGTLSLSVSLPSPKESWSSDQNVHKTFCICDDGWKAMLSCLLDIQHYSNRKCKAPWVSSKWSLCGV